MYVDPEAEYARTVTIDLDSLEPQVAVPHAVDHVVDLTQVAGTHVDVVFLGTCTNGRYEDLRLAAEVLDGRQVSPDVHMLVTPLPAGSCNGLWPMAPWRNWWRRGYPDYAWLRHLHGAAPGHPGRWRRVPFYRQSQFQRAHGRSHLPDLPGLASRGGRYGRNRRHHQPGVAVNRFGCEPRRARRSRNG